MTAINLLGFACEAFAYNYKIHPLIDIVYQKRKFEFYKLAQQSEFYNHTLLTQGSLIQEEYAKKTLGILLYNNNNEDEEITLDISNLFESGWNYIYTFLGNNNNVDLYQFMQKYLKKNKGIKNLTDDDINTNLIILYILAINSGKKIIQNKFLNDFLEVLHTRTEHYKPENRINVNNIPVEDKGNIKMLKEKIYNKIGKVTDYRTLLDHICNKPLNEIISIQFDYENITSSIFYNIQFNENVIDEIIYLYLIFHKDINNINTDDLVKHYISGIYIRYLIKSYKDVKRQYFNNNKETMFVELEELEVRFKNTKSQLEYKENEVKKLEGDLSLSEKRIKRLEAELENEKSKTNELNSLREFIFSLDSQTEYNNETEEVNSEQLKQIKGVIIGGHEKWQSRMKELLPNFTFIHTTMLNFDTSIFDAADKVFVYVNYINHAMYYKAMESVKNKDVKIYYLKQQNENLCLKDIYNIVKK
jgi:hypothetical protein